MAKTTTTRKGQPRRSSRVFKQFMAATLQPVQIEEPPTEHEAARVWAALSGQERAMLKGLVLGAATAEWPFRTIKPEEWAAIGPAEQRILEELVVSARNFRRSEGL